MENFVFFLSCSQIFACYISAYIHSQCTNIVDYNNSSIYKIDAISEFFGNFSKILLILFSKHLNFSFLLFTYLLSSFFLIISVIIYVYSHFQLNSQFYFISWFINRISISLIAGVRDYVIYKLIYSNNINVPFFKSIKTFGNILTIINTILFVNLKYTSIIIIISSIINFIFSIFFIISIYKNEKLQIKDEIKDIKINHKYGILVFLVCLFISIPKLSDQLVFIEMDKFGSEIKKYSILLKFFGQTIVGTIYSLLFKNNIIISIITPIIYPIIYKLYLYENLTLSCISTSMWGFTMILKNAALITIPGVLCKYNQVYQIYSYLGEIVGIFLANFYYDINKKFKTHKELCKIFITIGIISVLINAIIIYFLTKKKK